MAEQQAALLTLSVSTDQLSRIFLPTASETTALLLAARLNASQPGGACAACLSSESCVELLCAKVFTLFVAPILDHAWGSACLQGSTWPLANARSPCNTW